MAICVTCECGRYFETEDANAGKRAKCPHCGFAFVLPAFEPTHEDVLYIPAASHPTPPPEPERMSGKAIASVMISLVFVLGCFTGGLAVLLGILALAEINANPGRLRGRGLAMTGIIFGLCESAIFLLLPAMSHCGEAPYRAQCVNNLKQIAIALHNYHDVYECFPPAAITDREGRPLLSWRVAILPFLEQGPLYNEFHLDEPWNSPHNAVLLTRMPSTYRCSSDHFPDTITTRYQGIVGRNVAFRSDHQPLTFADFTDGTSDTIFVAESANPAPWTAPMEISADSGGAFASKHPGGFNAMLVDGSIRFLKKTIRPNVLTTLLTRNGGEPIGRDSY